MKQIYAASPHKRRVARTKPTLSQRRTERRAANKRARAARRKNRP